MAEAGRYVGTQACTRLTEVVEGLQVGQVALDVLAAARTFTAQVMVFAVGQRQLDVVSQVVADAATEQVAVVLEITGAIEEFLLSEALHFYSALALSESAQGRGGQQRANYSA